MCSKEKTNETTKNIIVQLVCSGMVLLGALISTIFAWKSSGQANKIQELQMDMEMRLENFRADLSSSQFEKRYGLDIFVMAYNELISDDDVRQKRAISLISTFFDDDTGVKLLEWAQSQGEILDVNKSEVKTELDALAIKVNSRFTVYVHTGKFGNRYVPTMAEIREAIEPMGFHVSGPTGDFDKYGPGVDYFFVEDRERARTLAEQLNKLLPVSQEERFVARRQTVMNRRGVLGVWF